MKYQTINGLDKPLSRLVLGCDSLPFHEGNDVSSLLEGMMELGINVFDTAHKYGNSEKLIGSFISSKGCREKVVIITKGCHPTKEGKSTLTTSILRSEIEQSFLDLNTDYIDIYLLHRDDPNMDLKGMLSVLNEYHQAGKIRMYGGSNWTAKRIEEANSICQKEGYAPFMASSPNYSLAEWENDPWGGVVSLSGASGAKEREFYEKTGMPVFAYSPLARGFLSGRVNSSDLETGKALLKKDAIVSYWSENNIERLKKAELLAKKKSTDVPSIALAYLLSSSIDVFPIIGTTNVSRMARNIKALDIILSEGEREYLNLERDIL